MIELSCAADFIKAFENTYSLKVYKIPLTFFNGREVLLLMCRCPGRWIALPYFSEAYIQTNVDPEEKGHAPFVFVESEDGNIFCTRNIRWEIRDRKVYSHNVYSDKLNFSISLGKTPTITEFGRDIRRKIRKARNNGIVVEMGGKNLLRDFYGVYSKRMYQLGSPAFGRRLLGRRVKYFDEKIFVARCNGKVIGASSLVSRDSGSWENHLFATDVEYNHLYTSYALHYAMIDFVNRQGCGRYYFGRSTRGSGVHNYKRHWKPQEEALFWSYSHSVSNIRRKKWLSRLWSKMPYGLVKIIGPFVSRKIY